MKTIDRILEITCFVASFLAFARCLSLFIGIHYFPAAEWIFALITLVISLWFGEVSRNELSKPHVLFIWMFSTVFFGAQAVVIYTAEGFPGDSIQFTDKCMVLMRVFTPDLNLGRALGALSMFYNDLPRYWMPPVSVVCFVAFMITLLKTRHGIQEAESGPGD